jgi:single-stranded-DNA-specific exonuclease
MTRWLESTTPPTAPPLDGLHPLVGRTLIRRGLTTADRARAFLDPDAYHPSPASDLPGMDAAAGRVTRAIRDRETICVWGDFDVDGQTATTVLIQTLKALGAEATYHIPVRAMESHGVNVENLAQVIDRGAQLVLTCDTGIGAQEAVSYARSRGVDLVITDHHDLPPELPEAAAVINPKLLPADHPLATLSGVGVAYKLAEALVANDPAANIHPSALLDLVALGLVADLVLLTGDCRYLLQRGLAGLRDTQRLGLRTMMELAELTPAHLTEEHIGFVLGPRLNALGRLGDANPAVELFTTQDPSRARLLATQLENYNAQRQLLCSQVTEAAEAQLRQDPSLLTGPILILSHPSWPGGVIGIVASRLVERYHKPAILFSTPPDGPARGSARSVEGLNVTAAISAQGDLLLQFGGHPMAAGLSLEPEKLPEFRRRMGRTVSQLMGKGEIEASVEIDGWLDLPDVTLDLAAEVEKLAPFGPGNEKLILATRNLNLTTAEAIGRNKEHLKLVVSDEAGNTQSVLWWNGAGEPLPEGRFDLAYTLRASDFRGVRQVQLEFVDLRVEAEEAPEIKSKKTELVDHRSADDPLSLLAALGPRSGTIVWAEGDDKKKVDGRNRDELEKADALAIWTPPPSPEILHRALETVRPAKIYLFAVDPGLDEPQAFLERLAGLIKYAIHKRSGRASYAELAAATSQREATVRKGVAWLVGRGQVTAESGADGSLSLGPGKLPPDEAGSAQLMSEIRTLLDETSAYRSHFRSAEPESLIE